MKEKKSNVLITSGVVDFQIAGNQTIKQTIKHFSKYFNITMLSFLPENYPNLDKNFEKNVENLRVLRLPRIFYSLFFKIRSFKNKFKLSSTDTNYVILDPQGKVDYFDNVSKIGLLMYNIATVGYLLLEFPRAFFYALRNKPIFIYGYEKDGAILASLVGKLLGIPVIKRFQGTPLKIENGKIKNKWWLYNFIISYKIFQYPVIMANDGTKGDRILEMLGVPKEKFLFIINGLVIENLEKAKYIDLKKKFNLRKDMKIILMLSKLKIWKRVDRGLWIIHKIVHKYKRTDFVLLIIGDGDQRMYLENLCKKLKIENNVIFMKALPHKEAMNYLKSCDVFWSFYDVTNLGNPLLEAIYFEKPIFTLDNDGDLDGLLGQDYEGLIKVEELFKVAKLTIKLVEDSNYRANILNKIKQAKSKLLSWEARIEKEKTWIEKFLH
jgi:glycosyltransferase involved in cell wall biosynthesis